MHGRLGEKKLGLSRQQLTLLGTLVRARGQTVSRETLLSEVWGSVVVSEGALRQAVCELRKLLGADDEKIIETVRGRGYRLIANVDGGARASTADRSGHARLLGRDLELDELERMRASARDRGGRACVLLGPAGVGKSRLAREIFERARTDGAACSASYADSAGALPPLWPWTQLLEACLHDAGDALRARCRSCAPSVFAWLESVPDRAGGGTLHVPSERRLAFFEQLSRALATLLRDEAHVCLVEDLQWADEASLAFLAHHCAELSADCSLAERIALDLARVEALHAEGGSNDEIRTAYLALVERASVASLAELQARAALGYAGHQHLRFVPARFAAAVDPHEVRSLERALAALDAHAPAASALRVLTLCSLAYALTGTGDVSRCRRLVQEAFLQAQALADPPLLARVLSFKIYVGMGPSQPAEALAACDALVELTLQHGLQELELEARIARYLLLFSRAERASALRDAERAELLAQNLGTERSRSRARLPSFIDAFGTGQLREAERLADEARDAAPDDANQQEIWFLRLASVQMLSGRTDLTQSVAGYEYLLSANPYAVNLRAVLSSAYATLGRHEDARRELDALAADDFAALPDDINWLPTMVLLADAVVHLRDAKRARPLYERLLPHTDTFLFFGVEVAPAGAVAMWLGELAVVLGDLERAHTWLERAQAIHGTLGMTLLDQYCALARARLLLASGCVEAARAARALMSQVRHFAEERGIVWLVECADELDAESAAASSPTLVHL